MLVEDGSVARGEGKAALNLDAERSPASARMLQKLNTEAGRARYRRRKVIPEPVFGWIKHVLGFKRISLRGLHKVTAEWNLVCMAVNLKHMQVLLRPA
jgi:DDE family transposase